MKSNSTVALLVTPRIWPVLHEDGYVKMGV